VKEEAMLVLVAYASDHGSTREIAERVAAGLRAGGHRVDLRDMARPGPAGRYEAAVLGSAIHDGSWLEQARGWMDRNLGDLTGRPVWLFSVGMSAALPRPMRKLAAGYEPREVAGYREVVRPVAHRLFSGVIRPEHLDRGGRVRFRALGCRYGDHRDWDAVEAWAAGIADRLTRYTASTTRR
jgi:menaquinone-dependent protoporphyrinogen oxidase